MYLLFLRIDEDGIHFFIARGVRKEEYAPPTYTYFVDDKKVIKSNCDFRSFAEWDDDETDEWEFLTNNVGLTFDVKMNPEASLIERIFGRKAEVYIKTGRL